MGGFTSSVIQYFLLPYYPDQVIVLYFNFIILIYVQTGSIISRNLDFIFILFPYFLRFFIKQNLPSIFISVESESKGYTNDGFIGIVQS